MHSTGTSFSPRTAVVTGFLATTLALSSLLSSSAAHAQIAARSAAAMPSSLFGTVGGKPLVPLAIDPTGTHTFTSVRELDAFVKRMKIKSEEQRKKGEARAAVIAANLHLTEAEREKREAAIEADEKQRGENGKNGEKEMEDGTDRLQALQQYLRMRAFPFDTIDTRAAARAIAHRDQMPAAPASAFGSNGTSTKQSAPNAAPSGGASVTAFGSSTPPGPLPGAKWQFIGPRNTPPPYQTYYGPPDSIINGRVNGIAYDPSHQGTIYLVAPTGGIWKTTDYGMTWTVLSDNAQFPLLQASSIAVHPTNTNILLAGMGDFDGFDGYGFSSGIKRSTDGGVTWTDVATQLMHYPVSKIEFDPDNPNMVVASVGRQPKLPNGYPDLPLFRSTDAGLTWVKANTGGAVGDWSQVTIGAKSPAGNRAYFASLIGDGVYRSLDRGATWVKLNVPLAFNGKVPDTTGLRVATSKLDPNTAYVIDGDADENDGRLFKTTNALAANPSWIDITGTYPDGFGYNSLAQLSSTPGYNWSQSWYDLPLNVGNVPVAAGSASLVDALYAGGITNSGSVAGSPNFFDIGKTYQAAPDPRTHSDQHASAQDPFDPLRSVFGNDGGIYAQTYNPNTGTWSTAGGVRLNAGLGITQFYHAAFHPTNADIMIGGSQDNASPTSLGDLQNWKNPGAGDGAGCAINTLNPMIQYNSAQNQDVFRTTDMWTSGNAQTRRFTYFSPTTGAAWDGDTTPFIGVMALSTDDPNFLLVGTNYLWMWDENSRQWTEHVGNKQLATALGATVSAVAVSSFIKGPVGINGIAYVGTDDGLLWMSQDVYSLDPTVVAPNPPKSTAHWVQLVNGLPPRAITSISINPINPYDVLVGVSGTGTGHLYRATNTYYDPANPPTLPSPALFTNQSGNNGFTNLPDVSLNDVTRDPNDPQNTYYAATDIGVFMTTTSGSSWTNATLPLGLPNVQVNAINAIPGTGYLNAATYGRGMWRIKLADKGAVTLALTPSFARNGANINVSLLVANSGSIANKITVTSATLTVGTGATATTYSSASVPVGVGTLTTGTSRAVTLVFQGMGNSVKPGTQAVLNIQGTYAGGTFQLSNLRTRLP